MAQRVTAADPAATVLKALEAVELLAADRSGVGLNQLARHLRSSRTSTVRVLAALERKHLVARDRETKRYRLTLRLLELGTRVLEELELPEIARPHLRALSLAAGETAHLGVLDGRGVIFVGKAEPPNPIRLHARVGVRAPSHCTSLGKVLLAGLPEAELAEFLGGYEFARSTPRTIRSARAFAEHLRLVRVNGYAVDDEEHQAGIVCAGAPVRDHSGRVIAAMSISGPAFRMSGHELPRLIPLVTGAAAELSAELGWRVRS